MVKSQKLLLSMSKEYNKILHQAQCSLTKWECSMVLASSNPLSPLHLSLLQEAQALTRAQNCSLILNQI